MLNLERWAGLTAALLTTVGACRTGPGRQVDVRIESPRPPAVFIANNWNLPGSPATVHQDGDMFRAKVARGRMPVAFLDLDGNGRLDLDREPMARCRKRGDWSCGIEPARLTVHRVQRDDEDSTLAFGEVFLPPTFARDAQAELCIADQGKCTSEPSRSPYLNAGKTLLVKLCDLTNKQEAHKEFNLELRSENKVLVAARTKQPPGMNLKTELSMDEREYRLRGTTSLSIDRVVVWSAELEGGETKKIHWTSEQNPEWLVRQDKAFEVKLPARIIEACPTCVIGVQAVSDVQVGPVTISSEGVAILRRAEEGS